ncbi:MAG: insulinase family protein [Candidatus Omnitrophica bacterium]|nr:insulinase family protein [Candidatus Omnitrophota bacterium]
MYSENKLANGLKVIVSPMPHMNSVSIGVWIGVGGRHENTAQSGISHFIEHMVFKGTLLRSAKELKESVEGVGGALNGFTSDEVTCYMVKVPARYFESGMDILTDMVYNPKFDEESIVNEKFVICEEIKMYKDQPAEHVHEILEGVMWPGNPMGRPLTGTISTVKSFKRDDIVKFKKKYYSPSNIAVVVVGKITTKEVMKYVSRLYKGDAQKTPGYYPVKLSQKDLKVAISRRKTKQMHLAIGFPVKNTSENDKFASQLTSVILGGNMSSRLFEELREKKGLCYDIASSFKYHKDIAEFVIHGGIDRGKFHIALSGIIDEVIKLKEQGVKEDELIRAKEFAKGQFQLGLESTSNRMIWLGDKIMVDGKIPDIEHILSSLDKVTCLDIKSVSLRIFSRSMANLAVIGDLAEKDKSWMIRDLERL